MSGWTSADTLARTVTFQEILNDAAVDVAMLPGTQSLDHGAAQQLTRGINAAYRYAWEYYDWPESRIITPLACDSHPVNGGHFVPRQTATGLRIATAFGFWTSHPLTDARNARPVCWLMGPDGFYLQGHDALTVVADYRTDAPRFDSREWEDTPVYPAGTIRFNPFDIHGEEDGNCYRSTVGTKGVLPGVSGQKGRLITSPNTPAYYEADPEGPTTIPDTAWVVQPLLWILAEAVKAGASAMYARAEGQYGTATVLEGAMVHLLDEQLLQNDTQMGNTKTYRQQRAG